MTRRKHKTIPFEFTGTAEEYFKIWIVNVGLTIATLGVYSAWAKVRRKRYLYGNTWLQGSSFEYLGDPIKILKGRLIVGGGLIVCFVAWYFLPDLDYYTMGFTWLLFLLILPWLVVMARTFTARNSSYCNIRFDFRTTWGEAYKIFCGLPALAVATVFLAVGVAVQTGQLWVLIAILVFPLGHPYFAFRRSEFIVNHTRYGTTPFTFSRLGKVGTFYTIYIWAGVVTVLLSVLLIIIFLMITFLVTGLYEFLWSLEEQRAEFDPQLFVLKSLLNSLPILVMYAYVKSEVTNFVWSNSKLGDRRFLSTLESFQMVWLYLSNAVAILLSLGLLIPWATIRTLRYRLDNLKLLPGGEAYQFVARQQDKISATGEKLSAFYDVDVGL